MGRVVDLQEAVRVCDQARREGKRIVFTNGCFDLFHHGHVEILEGAAVLGDLLVVAINDDASVRRLKGRGRPLQTLAARARVLAALAVVDLVVAFEADTPLETIVALRPEQLVKGADYADREVVGAEEVRGWGGAVELLPLIEGVSSSDLMHRIGRIAQSEES